MNQSTAYWTFVENVENVIVIILSQLIIIYVCRSLCIIFGLKVLHLDVRGFT